MKSDPNEDAGDSRNRDDRDLSTTELVNIGDYGREGVTPIDRSSQFGNPFELEKDGGSHTREESIDAYRDWFAQKIGEDPDFREDVEQLRGETLGCWCKPDDCHGDIILEYLAANRSDAVGSDDSEMGDAGDGRDRVAQRISESSLIDIGYFHPVRAGSKASAVSHSDVNNLSDDVPSSGNYGVCASSEDDLVLIDIDDHKDGYDHDALQYARDGLPDTLTFSSAHDGEGRLYQVPQDDSGRYPSHRLNETFGASNVSDCSWGEIRTDNQYIVGAGSQLDADGCTKDGCDACAKPDGGRYTILHDQPIATLEIDALIDIIAEDRDVDRVDQGQDSDQTGIGDSESVDSDGSKSDDDSRDIDPDQDDDLGDGDSDEDQSVYDALEDLNAEDIADDTIVYQWKSEDSKKHASGDDVRPFYPSWGENSNGTANVVGESGWKDTGGRGKGGPIVMAAIACDNISIFEGDRDDHQAQPSDVTGSDWVAAYEYLQSKDYDLPDLHDISLWEIDDEDDPQQAANALDATLKLYERDPDREITHSSQIWKAVGLLDEEMAADFADRVSDVLGVIAQQVVDHARLVDHQSQNGPIQVADGKTWYLAGQPRRRFELLNFELDLQSTLDVKRGPIHASLRADLPSGASFTKSIQPKIFNKKERFDDEILADSFGTKFSVPSVDGDQPYVQDLLDGLRMWIHKQDAPHRIGVTHMGLHDGELAIPNRTLTADGWTDAPRHKYLEKEIGAERRVSLPDEDADANLDDVAKIVETLHQTRDSERMLPVLGWFYAAPLRPVIESFNESGEFNHLSVTGETGSGKTATLGYLWRCFGMSGEPFSVDSSSFAQLATFSSTNSIPLWFDEYKPSDIREYKMDRFHDLFRKATRGAFAERGNADKTTTSYKIQAPICVSGEQQIQGPAERRRSIMTQFRSETTDAGTSTAKRFKDLIGDARMDDDDDIKITRDAPDPADHALAFYKWACDVDNDHIRDVWYQSLEDAHSHLNQDVVESMDDLETQGVQTVIFGFNIMHEFGRSVGVDEGALPGRDALDDAISYVVDRIGPAGSRKSHTDQFMELFGRAAAADDYIHRGTHYELTNEGQETEEIRINLPRTFDAISKYARDFDIDSTDLMNDHGDYRDRFAELASTGGSYVMRTQQYTPGVSNCTGVKTSAVVDALEFDRGVLTTSISHDGISTGGHRSQRDPDDDDQSGVIPAFESKGDSRSRDSPDDDDQSGRVLTSTPDADVQPVADIDPDDAIVASVAGDIQFLDNDGFRGESSDGPCMNFHIDDGTGNADVVIWDEDDLPAIFNDDGTVGVDSLMIRNAKPESAYMDDDDVQLVISQSTAVIADPGENQTLASTDGGQTGADTAAETLNEELDDAIIQETTKRQDGHGADIDTVAQAVADRLDISRDRAVSRIDDLLSAGRGIYEQVEGCIKSK